MAKIKNIFKKKKWLIIVLVLVIVLGCGLLFLNKNKKEEIADEFSYIRTVTLNYSSLQETIVSSGTIESTSTSTITSSVQNATISKINYAVGDYVSEGDVIIELDTTSLSKQISKASDSLSKQKQQLQDNYDEAASNYSEVNSSYKEALTLKQEAYEDYLEVQSIVEPYEQAYQKANDDLNDYIQEKLNEGVNKSDLENNKDNLYTDYISLKEALNTAKDNLSAIKSSTNYETLLKAYQEAESNYQTLKNSKSKASESLESAQDKLDEGVDEENLNDLYDTLTDYKLKAKSSGQITSLNAVLGASTNGTLATIQDTEKLKISLTIDEYDILKIELGMKAKIETDASDVVYEGEVSMISHVASSSMSSSGFEIEVTVTSEDVSQLLIGMNAEVTIIVSSTEDNFNVPVDAVETKDDGSKVIYVENQDGEFEEVKVSTGETKGYYVEIFGDDLKQGMKVRASANEDEAKVSISEDEISQEGFDLFSQGGGNMPSGSSDMPSGGMGGGDMRSGGFDGR